MSENLIKYVFSIIGTLLVSIILFILVFGTLGQQTFWKIIEPTMIRQWQESTLDNGAERTIVFEKQFEEMESVKFNG